MSDPTPIRPEGHTPAGPTQYVYLPQQPVNQTSGLALAAMICGLVGLIFGPLSILAVIFGHVALGNIRRSGQPGKGMAWTGLVCGYLVCAFWVVLLGFVIASGATA